MQIEDQGFERFFQLAEPRLRLALVARYGPDRGEEAAAEALSYAWQNWAKVADMDNPVGYLYRVGQSRTRRWHLPRPPFVEEPSIEMPWVEPRLAKALNRLSPRQRQCVVMEHVYEFTRVEVAEVLGISTSAARNHAERGLAKLKNELEDRTDAMVNE